MAKQGTARLAAVTRPVSHGWLLPRCAAMLHAGGAGTVAAMLLAGLPQVVCPLHFDQPAWVRARLLWLASVSMLTWGVGHAT